MILSSGFSPEEDGTAAPIRLRQDFDAAALRRLAKASRDPTRTRRLLALSAIYAGVSRTQAAALSGVGLQTVRDWVLAFNVRRQRR